VARVRKRHIIAGVSANALSPGRLSVQLALFLLLASWAVPASAQEAEAPEAPPGAEALREIAQRERDALPADAPTLAGYDELITLLLDRETEDQNTAQLASEAAELAADSSLPVAKRVGSGPPYFIAQHDEFEDRFERATRDLEQADRAREVATEAVEAAVAERAELPVPQGDPVKALARRIGDQRIELGRELAANADRAFAMAEQRAANAKSEFEWVADHTEIGPDEASGIDEEMDQHDASMRRGLERAELALKEAEQRWSRAADAPADVRAALRATLTLRQKAVALRTTDLQRMKVERESRRRRLAVLGHQVDERTTLIDWLDDARANLAQLARERRLNDADLQQLVQERAELAERAGPAPTGSIAERLGALEQRIQLHRDHDIALAKSEHGELRLATALEYQAGSASWKDRLDEAVVAAKAFWAYEVSEAGDSPITVGKIVLAIALIVFGLIGARLVSRLLEKRLLPGFGLDRGASHAFAELVFYALLVIVFLFSLRVVSIPITAFAVVGGALAIGVGFGSQNVVNNFISGIILLAERPIKIGDLVQVDQTYGNVERIGLRSTRVRTGQNIHVIVPNATFLETNVVNWTLSDARVRIMVAVGVAYGSPTREVETRIRVAVEGIEAILPRPEPIVLFKEFGDNALHFEVHFWVRIRHQMEGFKIESDLRYAIDDSFREAGIVIAYPQRDLHVDTLQPLEVRMVGDGTQRDESS
jgi:small-conductance mechanosensitive channel